MNCDIIAYCIVLRVQAFSLLYISYCRIIVVSHCIILSTAQKLFSPSRLSLSLKHTFYNLVDTFSSKNAIGVYRRIFEMVVASDYK